MIHLPNFFHWNSTNKKEILNNTTWHESGHAVFANIFKDHLVIQKVTILPNEYGKGVNIISSKKLNETYIDDFHLIIVNLAGLVVEMMKDKRSNDNAYLPIINYLLRRLKQGNDIKDSFDGDFLNIQEPLTRLSESIQKPKDKILAMAMLYIANCLTKCLEFWPAIDALTEELDKTKTLLNKEINDVFNRIGFNQFLNDSKERFLEESIRILKDNDIVNKSFMMLTG